MITIDVSQRLLHVDLSAAELAARRAAWSAPAPNYAKGVMAKYAQPGLAGQRRRCYRGLGRLLLTREVMLDSRP